MTITKDSLALIQALQLLCRSHQVWRNTPPFHKTVMDSLVKNDYAVQSKTGFTNKLTITKVGRDALKSVSKCVNHEHAKKTPLIWNSWAYVGEQDDGDGGKLELRNCPNCGSTLAKEI